jgi:hypothetical protein
VAGWVGIRASGAAASPPMNADFRG